MDWLAGRLSRLDSAPARAASEPAQSLDAALKARVMAFQRAQGLQPDGRPGPMTLMQISRATGVDEPRLNTTPP